MASGVSVASAPPVTTARASPDSIIRAAAPIAWVPDAQADMTPNTGPFSPWRIATRPEAALPMIRGSPWRDASRAAVAEHVVGVLELPMPPMPEPITQPIAVGS